MNATAETELTETFSAALDALTPEASTEILCECNEFTASIKKDPAFQKLEENRSLFMSMIDLQTAAFEKLRKSPLPTSVLEPNAVRWVQLLAGIAPYRDFNVVALQFALFIIAQEHGIFPIKDDNSRLFVCYLHVRIACNTLMETAVSGRN
jgi:hypothetical protein